MDHWECIKHNCRQIKLGPCCCHMLAPDASAQMQVRQHCDSLAAHLDVGRTRDAQCLQRCHHLRAGTQRVPAVAREEGGARCLPRPHHWDVLLLLLLPLLLALWRATSSEPAPAAYICTALAALTPASKHRTPRQTPVKKSNPSPYGLSERGVEEAAGPPLPPLPLLPGSLLPPPGRVARRVAPRIRPTALLAGRKPRPRCSPRPHDNQRHAPGATSTTGGWILNLVKVWVAQSESMCRKLVFGASWPWPGVATSTRMRTKLVLLSARNRTAHIDPPRCPRCSPPRWWTPCGALARTPRCGSCPAGQRV